jgi:hypothetical protein
MCSASDAAGLAAGPDELRGTRGHSSQRARERIAINGLSRHRLTGLSLSSSLWHLGPRRVRWVTDLDLGAGDNGLVLACKARQVRRELTVIYQTGSPEMFAGHGFLPGERVYYKLFDPRALATTIALLGGKRLATRRRQRLAARKTLASNL